MAKHISIEEIQYIAYKLAKKYMDWDEPIPSFSERFPGVLESCIIQPFQKISGQVLYRGLSKKASILFYLMIKNHPFRNGNKRIAVFTLNLFLFKNQKWLKISNQKLYEFSLYVAESPSGSKDKIIREIEEVLKSNTESIIP